jgi:hypothetical protein
MSAVSGHILALSNRGMLFVHSSHRAAAQAAAGNQR